MSKNCQRMLLCGNKILRIDLHNPKINYRKSVCVAYSPRLDTLLLEQHFSKFNRYYRITRKETSSIRKCWKKSTRRTTAVFPLIIIKKKQSQIPDIIRIQKNTILIQPHQTGIFPQTAEKTGMNPEQKMVRKKKKIPSRIQVNHRNLIS